MGYGYYVLSSGKEAGYSVDAICEHPGCNERIDRGMSYCCGGEPGDQGGCSCEGYFCSKHLFFVDFKKGSHEEIEIGYKPLCAQCVSYLAFTDKIEEADFYRKDPTFHPNKETQKNIDTENEFLDYIQSKEIVRDFANDLLKQNIQWRISPIHLLKLCDALDNYEKGKKK